MSHAPVPRARLVFVITSALIVAGAVTLFWPTSLDAHDRWGFPIACGSGFSTDYAQAASTDHDTTASGQQQGRSSAGYVAACESAVTRQRVWATSLAVTGVVGLIALRFRGRRARSSANQQATQGN